MASQSSTNSSPDDKNKEFFQRAIQSLVINPKSPGFVPFYAFVSGKAGRGKGVKISALCQTIMRFPDVSSADPGKVCILHAGSTGSVAAMVKGGMTMHSVFRFPPFRERRGRIADLSPEEARSIRTEWAQLRLIIIDEIQTVSVRQFFDIDQRLRQIFATNQDFGGISVIFVGDFDQVPHVEGLDVNGPPKHLLTPEGLPIEGEWDLWKSFRK